MLAVPLGYFALPVIRDLLVGFGLAGLHATEALDFTPPKRDRRSRRVVTDSCPGGVASDGRLDALTGRMIMAAR